jgi:hypothetical protein
MSDDVMSHLLDELAAARIDQLRAIPKEPGRMENSYVTQAVAEIENALRDVGDMLIEIVDHQQMYDFTTMLALTKLVGQIAEREVKFAFKRWAVRVVTSET